MNITGRITTADCTNILPPPDPRCADDAFRIANPDICFSAPILVIKPAVALVCTLGSTQFQAFYVKNGVETDVTAQSVFTSSNQSVALVGAVSGNATGISLGQTIISAAYQSLTAQSEMNVLGDNCCTDRSVAMMLAMDTSRSMSQAFGGSYSTRLDYAKAAATRFINEVNETKDIVGLMRFNATDDVVLAAPVSAKASVSAFVSGIAQTQNLTTLYDALSTALGELNATSATLKVLVLLSDGEDDTDSYIDNPNPIQLLSDFKSQGGIVICFGTRASGKGFNLLSTLATGGFFLNGYPANAQAALDYLSGLKGYVCAGNCVPTGDVMMAHGQLDYDAFINWDVIGPQKVDLLGNGFFDYLPGTGLHVELVGNIPPAGTPTAEMVTKATIPLSSTALVVGHVYSVSVKLAGNQVQEHIPPDSVRIKVYDAAKNYVDSIVTLSDFKQGYQWYTYSFTADSVAPIRISIQQVAMAPQPTPGAWAGAELKEVKFQDTTNGTLMFDDNFDTENIIYIPPACGLGTTYVLIPGSSVATFTNNGPSACQIGTIGVPNAWSEDRIDVLPGQTIEFIPNAYLDIFADALSPDPILEIAIPGGSSFVGSVVWNADNGNDQNSGTGNPAHLVFNAGGSHYGYAYGYAGCYGYGCLDTPPAAQLPDPNPLPDIEQGFTPPKTYTSTKTACAVCPIGTINSGSGLIPVMTSFTAPSGLASNSSTGGRLAWKAFADPDFTVSLSEGWDSDHAGVFPQWLAYTFDTAKVVVSVGLRAISRITHPGAVDIYNDIHWQFQASTDGASWTTLTEGTGNSATFGIAETQYGFANTTAYRYYRLYFPNDATNVSGYAIVYRMQLYGSDSGQVCKSATETSLVSQQDADTKAYNAALVLANAALNCTHVFTSTQSYTAHCPSNQFGPPVTKSATATSLVDQATADAAALAAATAAANAALVCNLSNNTQAITINDSPGGSTAPATPFPSVKFVSGLVGLITKVTVSIKKFSHTYPDDVLMVLMSPHGEKVMLMQHCGGPNSVSNLDLVFDDAAGGFLPDATILSSGTFKPSQYGVVSPIPSPGPAAPYSALLSAFNGFSGNGSWSLWVYDSAALNVGSIALGWDLTITSV